MSSAPGFVVGGAGAVALIVGSAFGVRAFSQHSDSDAACPNNACTAKGVSLNDKARTSAWIANVGIGLGLVGIRVGTYLVVTSPNDAAPAPKPSALVVVPTASPDGAGVAMLRTF